MSLPTWAAWPRATSLAGVGDGHRHEHGAGLAHADPGAVDGDDGQVAAGDQGVGVVARAVGGEEVDALAVADGGADAAPLDGERELTAAGGGAAGDHRADLEQLAGADRGEERGAGEQRRVVEGPGPEGGRQLDLGQGQVAGLEPGAGGERPLGDDVGVARLATGGGGGGEQADAGGRHQDAADHRPAAGEPPPPVHPAAAPSTPAPVDRETRLSRARAAVLVATRLPRRPVW